MFPFAFGESEHEGESEEQSGMTVVGPHVSIFSLKEDSFQKAYSKEFSRILGIVDANYPSMYEVFIVYRI
jgi:hypothetical protein